MMEDAGRVELTHSEDATDIIHKWLAIHFSFLLVQIRLPSFVVMRSICIEFLLYCEAR